MKEFIQEPNRLPAKFVKGSSELFRCVQGMREFTQGTNPLSVLSVAESLQGNMNVASMKESIEVRNLLQMTNHTPAQFVIKRLHLNSNVPNMRGNMKRRNLVLMTNHMHAQSVTSGFLENVNVGNMN